MLPSFIRDSRTRVLTRHFLRRFLDNDLISPHVDLHENVAVVLAGIASTAVFLTFLLSMKYLAGSPAPAEVAVYAMGDKTFFLAASMVGMALVAAMQWDAVALDMRDAANLCPLPLERRTLVTAKIAALVIFASAFAAALTLVPSGIHSILHVTRLRVSLVDIVQVLAAHLSITLAACAFGFAAVIAIREVLRAALGDRWFRRVSPLLQAALVLLLLSVLPLLPALSNKVVNSWVESGFPNAHLLPPLWFLGLWETLSGQAIAAIDFPMPPRVFERNARYLADYQSNLARFEQLARIGVMALAGVVTTAIAAYAWNARRLPQPPAASQRHRRTIARLTSLFAGPSATRAAGFSLALRTIARSAPHRLAIAAAGAAALALSLALLSALTPLRVLMHQTAVLTVLLLGFRHAVRMPADLRATWIFQIGQTGHLDRYRSGVKRAGVVGLALPVVVLLFPLSWFVLGPRAAVAHAGVGLFFAIALTEATFARARHLPLVSPYSPGGNFKKVAPIGVIAFFVLTYNFARVEHAALASLEGTATLLAGLAGVFAASRLLDVWRRDRRAVAAFEEPPDTATQWLGLSH